MLLSPTISLPISAMDSSRQPSGSSFTSFLTVPLQAFILMLGFTASDIDMEMYGKAEKLLSSSLNEWGLLMAAPDNLNPVWSQTLGDPFLRRLILRSVATLPQHFLQYSYAVLPTSAACQRTVLQLADIFGATSRFNFSNETVLSDDRIQEN
ncbi:hypothetical protein A4A49_56134 [Nicotiana attenuata]|uniref:Uncharacterized protein n=1 Tax=Nicotiana attenuata TaxID=49451 RepID=A0A314KTS0_NICAT|nr:hypothetical protein A4A49_56134 [Nicotiana attenuata]